MASADRKNLAGMSEMLKQGYDALDEDFRDPSAIEPWEKAWEIVKEKVRNAEMPLEIYEVDEATDYEYNLEEWISEMTDSYRRMEKMTDVSASARK